jgi:hypothetical protein
MSFTIFMTFMIEERRSLHIKRYVIGLATAYAVYVVAFTGLVVALAAGRAMVAGVLPVALLFGFIGVFVLALVVGPSVLLVRAATGGRLHPGAAAAVGALLSPVCLFAIWFLFREGGETITGLLRFWLRLPGEFVGGVVPWMLANAVFAAWIVRDGRPRRLPAPARA